MTSGETHLSEIDQAKRIVVMLDRDPSTPSDSAQDDGKRIRTSVVLRIVKKLPIAGDENSSVGVDVVFEHQVAQIGATEYRGDRARQRN
jgi:hypothetical protein